MLLDLVSGQTFEKEFLSVCRIEEKISSFMELTTIKGNKRWMAFFSYFYLYNALRYTEIKKNKPNQKEHVRFF